MDTLTRRRHRNERRNIHSLGRSSDSRNHRSNRVAKDSAVEVVEILLPSSWAETHVAMRWPEDIYAGRLSTIGERIRLADLPVSLFDSGAHQRFFSQKGRER